MARVDEYAASFDSFDVVVEQVIGTVEVDHTGHGIPPNVVAFDMIARNDSEGTYSFPMLDGRRVRVTVEWVGESIPG